MIDKGSTIDKLTHNVYAAAALVFFVFCIVSARGPPSPQNAATASSPLLLLLLLRRPPPPLLMAMALTMTMTMTAMSLCALITPRLTVYELRSLLGSLMSNVHTTRATVHTVLILFWPPPGLGVRAPR